MPARLEGYAFYVPDAFATGSDCLPPRLAAFQAFNLTMSRQSGRNVPAGVPLQLALRMLARGPLMMQH